MSTTRAILALFAALLLILGGGFAIRGWLTNMPDSAPRYKWRLACFIALYAGSIATFDSWNRHHWWEWVLIASIGLILANKISDNWKALERCRELDRIRAHAETMQPRIWTKTKRDTQ
jgi:hypothetical protein